MEEGEESCELNLGIVLDPLLPPQRFPFLLTRRIGQQEVSLMIIGQQYRKVSQIQPSAVAWHPVFYKVLESRRHK